ncbi:hypothetical protein ACFY4C_35530 [Actinomadura viridis]|uniref:hypothetical protein n=1 Tax=Actinomadura viridis TaxID=58110 RepID=UPI003680307B
MPFLVCAHCAQGLTTEIEQTTAPAQDVPGRPYLPAGAYKPSWNGGFVVNRHDVTGAIRHPDQSRSAGCCGPHGLDGPNLVCSGCGREVGTEESDCWKPHFVVTLPTATALVPELPEAPK